MPLKSRLRDQPWVREYLASGQPVWPWLLGHARLMHRAAMVPTPPRVPTITSLEAQYEPPPDSVPEALWRARLAACRACDLWDEPARGGHGRCNSVRCNCSRRELWRAAEHCPEGRWPA